MMESLESKHEELKELLKLRLAQLKRTNGTRARLTDSRIKKPAKIWKKAKEYGYSPSKAFEKICDILGFRIVCNNLKDVNPVIEMLKSYSGYFEIKSIKDMISEPADDGYRAVHVLALTHPLNTKVNYKIPFEIQIRTLAQDTWGILSRADLYGKRIPDTFIKLMNILSEQLQSIDDTAQLIRNELDKPVVKSEGINDSDSISPQRLALLFNNIYNEDIYEWGLLYWMANLEEAEAETIKDVKDLIGNGSLRKKLDDDVKKIRSYSLDNLEWVVYSAKIAAELNEEIGTKVVIDEVESEWDELSSFALRETLPLTIETFIEELEFSLSYTKDAIESNEDIKMYFSLLDCISQELNGEIIYFDEWCAVEAIQSYYEDESHEERLQELLSEWKIMYA